MCHDLARGATLLSTLLASTLLPPGVRAQDVAGPGTTWQVTAQGGWTAVWTPRGDDGLFDAAWTGPNGQTDHTVERVRISGNSVDASRTDGACWWKGTISSDRSGITGRADCGYGTFDWIVTIRGAAAPVQRSGTDGLGSVWKVTAQGGWTAVWTRRGDGELFDASWTGPDGQTDHTVERVSISDDAVDARRTDGACWWKGTLSPDRGAITGTADCGYGVFPWIVTIGGGPAAEKPASIPSPGPARPARSLTGSWVHSMDPNVHHDDKVIVLQEGNRVTMVRAEKYRGEWIVSKCVGMLEGLEIQPDCDYTPGGNPFGFPATTETWTVSADATHLDGTTGRGQETHYSRLP